MTDIAAVRRSEHNRTRRAWVLIITLAAIALAGLCLLAWALPSNAAPSVACTPPSSTLATRDACWTQTARASVATATASPTRPAATATAMPTPTRMLPVRVYCVRDTLTAVPVEPGMVLVLCQSPGVRP